VLLSLLLSALHQKAIEELLQVHHRTCERPGDAVGCCTPATTSFAKLVDVARLDADDHIVETPGQLCRSSGSSVTFRRG
jgi:hypothetical protein